MLLKIKIEKVKIMWNRVTAPGRPEAVLGTGQICDSMDFKSYHCVKYLKNGLEKLTIVV